MAEKEQGMSRWSQLVDRLIDEARERGEFNTQSTRGKPLTDDHEDVMAGDMAMANKVLKNGGYAPDFIMLNGEIDEDIKQLRTVLQAAARRRARLLAKASELKGAAAEQHEAEASLAWTRALEEAETKVQKINSKILTFNLKNRIPNMHRYRVQLPTLIDEVLAEVERE